MSMYKLNYAGHATNEERLEWEKKWGSFNDFPPNWEEISANQYWHTRSMFMPHTIEYRQMYPTQNRMVRCTTAHLEFYGNNPFAPQGMAVVYGNKEYNSQTKEYDYTPKFFKFASCVHEWDPAKSIDTGRGWHERTCTKCGTHVTWDSGD